MLAGCPEGCVLAVHSPPRGHVDVSSSGEHLGSTAVLETINEKRPRLALCGHIHEAWGERSGIGPTEVINLGPGGVTLEIPQ
jgi:Icc-related predicted phosphoesterase